MQRGQPGLKLIGALGKNAMGWGPCIGFAVATFVAVALLRWPLSALLVMSMAALCYYVLPDVKQEFKFITPGSVVATLLWLLVTLHNYVTYDWALAIVLLAAVREKMKSRQSDLPRSGSAGDHRFGAQPYRTMKEQRPELGSKTPCVRARKRARYDQQGDPRPV